MIKPKKESNTLIQGISNVRNISPEIIGDIMQYNVLTPLQLVTITGFSRAKVEMMILPRPVPKLTVVYPFSAYINGEGPKFILKDRKFYELISYLIWRGKKKTQSLKSSIE